MGGRGWKIAGLVNLNGLTRLETLTLENIPLVDADPAPLRGLTALKNLGLTCPRVTDAGMVHFKVSEIWIADTDAIGLAALTSLTKLDLSGTKITDASLAHISASPSLTMRRLRGTKVTAAGVAALHKARLQLQVAR
jgi:Leucine-rich repeat (LRR) protein